VVLKKPSEIFTRKKEQITSVEESIQSLEKQPELNTFSDAFDAFKNNLSKIQVLSEFSDTLDNYRVNIERVNHLSEKVEDIQTEIQTLLKKEDLDRAMMSQLLVVEQNIRDLQSKVAGINEKNLTEIRSDVSGLTESVNEFLEIEVPKYQRLIIESEIRSSNRYETFENNISYLLKEIEEIVETEIPQYKDFIVDGEKRTELQIHEFKEKFQERIGEIILDIEKKSNLFENDKKDLINKVNQKIADVKKLSEKVYAELQNNDDYKEKIVEKLSNLEVDIVRNETHIKVQNKNLQVIQEEVKKTLDRINLEEIEKQNYKLGEKVKYLEEIFEKFNEKEIINQTFIIENTVDGKGESSSLTEPPSADNKDPLTPLDQNFVTLNQLQEHYRLFLNRIQQQLSTLGGGGETRLKYLDDIVGIATNPSVYDGKVLSYNHSIGKFEFITGGGGGNAAITISDTPPLNPQSGNLWYDNTIGRTFIYYVDVDGAQWVDASPSGLFGNWTYTNTETITQTNVGIGTTTLSLPSSKLEVFGGDVRVGVNTSEGLVMTSPNGTNYRLIVNDDGTLTTSLV
jgi:hypothetical protein